MSKNRATMVGFTAVILWSFLALFTVGTTPVPPLQLNAISFAVGGAIGLIWVWRTTGFGPLRSVSWKIYAFGTAGLFGYHFLYFSALRAAPPAQAGLIAYLWPLLIVLFSGFLPGENLRAGHIVGAVISLGGAAIIVLAGAGGFEAGYSLGYGLAIACALVWAGYSVMSRRFDHIPTSSVAVFCIATAVLSLAAHLALEETVWPSQKIGWGAMLALGLGPVGLAFYVWDTGVKNGDIQLLGVLSYAAPIFSTFILVAAGVTELRWPLFAAALLISGGAFIAARASTAALEP